MKIGFPVVGDNDACSLVVCEIIKDTQGKIVVTENERTEPLTIDQFQNTYQKFIQSLIAAQYSLHIEIRSATTEAKQLLSKEEPGRWTTINFTGSSGTLAFFVLQELHEQIVANKNSEEVFLSGELLQPGTEPTLKGLGGSKLTLKAAACQGNSFWLLKSDYDTLPQEQQPGVTPFLAPQERPEWLIHEFCGRHNLALPAKYTTKKEVKSPQTVAELDSFEKAKKTLDEHQPLTERNLIETAINALDADTTLRNRITQHFLVSPPRDLLEIQKDALRRFEKKPKANDTDEDEYVSVPLQGVFEDREQTPLRHVLISGPTGCGKTSLIHSLVLNAMYNRSGGTVYVGPVKALVEEFHQTATRDFKLLRPQNDPRRVVISTSDFWKDDAWITRGTFGLACMVYEKASILFTADEEQSCLRSISLLIVDELHMLQDITRGDVVDLLIVKCFKENKRRVEKGEPIIQMVMISTENILDKLINLDDFKVEYISDGIENQLGPIFLSTQTRNPPVTHSIGMIDTEFKPNISLLDICEFDNNSKRKFDTQSIAKKRTDLKKSIPSIESKLSKDKTNVYIDLIEEQIRTDHHHTVIVVCSAINACHEYAGHLSKRLKHPLDQRVEFSAEFIAEAAQSGLSQARINQIVLWSRSGVFVHHAQLPSKLRICIGNIFREKLRPNSRPKVLFTTETLTYGVNLSASCVILTNRFFTKEDPTDPKVTPQPEQITQNQYHNLLGCAGRKGHEIEGLKNRAIVILERHVLEDAKHFQEFLTDFYSQAGPPDIISTIAHRSDQQRYRHAEAEIEPDRAVDLKTFSFSIFRTVLECVRTAGANKSTAEIFTVFKLTLGFQTAPPFMQIRLQKLFEEVLHECKKYKTGVLKLIESDGNQSTIRPTARALIDTGTTLHSLEPIALWLQSIVGEPDYPPEALLPGLITAPEFTKVACELFGLAKGNRSKDSTDNAREEKLQRAISQAIEECTTTFGDQTLEFFRKVDKFFSDDVVAHAMTIIPDRMDRLTICYRLLSVTSSWIRGADNVEIQELFRIFNKSTDKPWLLKHSDRLEQLVKMTYRFFSQGEDFLSSKLKLELPQFAIRVKHGIPFLASPYVDVAGTDGVLPRSTVNILFSNFPEPFALLDDVSNKLLFEKLTTCLQQIQGNNKPPEAVVATVCGAYVDNLKYFLSQLFSSAIQEKYAPTLECLGSAEMNERFFSCSWQSQRLLSLYCGSPEAANACTHDNRNIFQCWLTSEVKNTYSIYLLNWHEVGSKDFWTITPCGFVLMQVLMLRSFLTLQTLVGQLSCNKTQRIDIEWIATHLWDSDELADKVSLRESMLSFLEPMRR